MDAGDKELALLAKLKRWVKKNKLGGVDNHPARETS